MVSLVTLVYASIVSMTATLAVAQYILKQKKDMWTTLQSDLVLCKNEKYKDIWGWLDKQKSCEDSDVRSDVRKAGNYYGDDCTTDDTCMKVTSDYETILTQVESVLRDKPKNYFSEFFVAMISYVFILGLVSVESLLISLELMDRGMENIHVLGYSIVFAYLLYALCRMIAFFNDDNSNRKDYNDRLDKFRELESSAEFASALLKSYREGQEKANQVGQNSP